jgi:hypothetical protein
MNTVIFAVFGTITIFGVLHYFMFITRKTILRAFGWTAFTIGFIFISLSETRSSRSLDIGMNSIEIINDLRTLKGAAYLFYLDFEAWPLPGQEASLDVYVDRPMTLTKHPKYARVMLAVGSGDANDFRKLYVGIELIPKSNGTKGIQKKLAANAINAKLLQRPISGDIYTSGLSVYMQVN